MSDGKIVYTIKQGTGYDAPWIVVSGDTVEEANALLVSLSTTNAYHEVSQAAALFQGSGTAAVLTVPQPVPTAPAPVYPTAAPAVPAPPVPQASANPQQFCPHGQRTRKTGTSSRGPWTAFFCPLPKGHPDQCDAVFVNG